MRTIDEILKACPSTEPATFYEFLSELDDVPEKGDKPEWAALFRAIEKAERAGLIQVQRDDGKIDLLMLTPEGAERVKGL